jgi:probable HAF family extracellular repeat protein
MSVFTKLSLAIGLGAVSTMACSIQYRVIELGFMPADSTSSNANGINNSNQVSFQGDYACRWQENTGLVELPHLDPTRQTFAYKIASNGTIAGCTYPLSNGFLQAVIWKGDQIIALPGNLGEVAYANAVNASDVAVGVAVLPDKAWGRAMMWKDGQMIEMRDLGVTGLASEAFDINDQGQVVGTRQQNSSSRYEAFLWSESTGMVLLGSLDPSEHHYAYAINDVGQVVGGSGLNSFIWDSTHGMQAISGLPDILYSYAEDINNQGWVVGNYGASFGRGGAFLYNGSEMLDMNDLLESGSKDWNLRVAKSINDNGWIVGYGQYNGHDRAFLAIPVPEPTSLIVVGLGAGWLALRRRRKS